MNDSDAAAINRLAAFGLGLCHIVGVFIATAVNRILRKDSARRCKQQRQHIKLLHSFPLRQTATASPRYLEYRSKLAGLFTT